MLTLSAIPGLIAFILQFFLFSFFGGRGGMQNNPAGKELKAYSHSVMLFFKILTGAHSF